MKVSQSQLRNVVRSIISEQAENQRPIYYTDSDGQEYDWGDVEDMITDEVMCTSTGYPRNFEACLRKVTRAARSVGFKNLPADFLNTVADRLMEH